MKTFKKTFFLLLFICSLTSFTKLSSYTGKWKGEDKGDIGFLTLSKDGFASFETNGRIMGGKSYKMKEIDASMTYEIKTNITPNTIDFIIHNNSTKTEIGRMRGLVELESNDKLKLTIGFGGAKRPTDFSKDAITFDRVK